MAKENLFGLTEEQLMEIMLALGEKKFRGKQLSEWIYRKGVRDFDEMTNFSTGLREKLAAAYRVDWGEILTVQEDPVDGTRKYLIGYGDASTIEAVLMQHEHGASLCVSSQVGCRMGCAFCASTQGGLGRNLTAAEILGQLYLVGEDRGQKVDTVVIMGMGEPLDNYEEVLGFIYLANTVYELGIRRITLSTCGLVPQIDRLAGEGLRVNLAVSLHSASQAKRETLMPIARKYPLKDLFKSCNNYFTKTGRRITYEYALIQDFNDGKEDLKALIAALSSAPGHVNLIPLNPVDGSVYKKSKNVNFFSNELKRAGVPCTIRRTMGSNIDGACGQLRQRYEGSPGTGV